ncbi:hypothetical protein SK128_004718 [Halocaridina rubra]|uniref:Major facilitator superfamily (MFS) profile domain-containing protein n=1 Tax=Halocaridina rubra TaxID=373956 RepID=A0AAN8WP80_HALRR
MIIRGKTILSTLLNRWFRGKEYDCESELQAAKENIQELQAQGKAGIKVLNRPYILRPLLISLGLMFFQQLCGVNAILFNANTIFRDSGSSLGDNASSVIVAATQSISTLCASIIMDKAGRRILLLFSSAVMTVSLVAVGAYFFVKEKNEEYATGTLGWLPLTGLVVFMIAFSIAYGPIPWLMMGELFPRDAREIAGSIASSTNWGLSFIVTLGFGPLQDVIGSYSVYWIFASVCVLSFFFCLYYVPETKGRTLEEITQLFVGPSTSLLNDDIENKFR